MLLSHRCPGPAAPVLFVHLPYGRDLALADHVPPFWPADGGRIATGAELAEACATGLVRPEGQGWGVRRLVEC